MKYTKDQIAEACDDLRATTLLALQGSRPAFAIGHGIQVHAIVRHVSKSGMSRRIDFFVLRNEWADCITRRIAILLGMPFHPDKGLKVDGCGMDMGFHCIYEAKAAYERHTHMLLDLDPQVRYL